MHECVRPLAAAGRLARYGCQTPKHLIGLALAGLLLSGALVVVSSLTVVHRADTTRLRTEIRRLPAQSGVPNDELVRRIRTAADLIDVQTELSTRALELAESLAAWLAVLSATQIWLLLRDRRSEASRDAG
jgi:hypothetical protein